ncbi:MAG: glutaredoxin family protein [Undibacterium sp.]|nr:glutaredoxin family protein [Undibacterium sp.]
MIQFTLYSRSYCHLCDDMLVHLQALKAEQPFSIEVIDVDTNPTLLAQFDELVPVLFGKKPDREPKQLCHYFLDVAQVEAFLHD